MLLLAGHTPGLAFVTMGNMPGTACVVSSPFHGNTWGRHHTCPHSQMRKLRFGVVRSTEHAGSEPHAPRKNPKKH